MDPDSSRFLMAGRALAALIAGSFLVPAPLAAQTGASQAARAECEADSSGRFSLSLSDDTKALSWRIAAALPARSEAAGTDAAPPIALRAGFAAGPLFIGAILPSTELQRLKDPLDHAPCAALDAQRDSAVCLDERPLGASAVPGFQGAPGAAFGLERAFPAYRSLPETELRLGAGFFPADECPLLGVSAVLRSRLSAARLAVELSALADPFGRGKQEPEEGWYRSLRPPLPAGYPIALGRGGLGLEWGPLACVVGIYASNGSLACLSLYGEGGVALKLGDLEALAALILPLNEESSSRIPLLAIDGLPSGRAGWAEAGMEGAWRWKAAWKDKGGFRAKAAYSGSTARPIKEADDFLPRREKLEAEAGYDWKLGRTKGSAALDCSRVVQWESDGGAQASEDAALAAGIDFSPKGRAAPTFKFSGEFGFAVAQGPASGFGAAAPFLIIAPGSMGGASVDFSFKAECGCECSGFSATARLSSEDGGKRLEFKLRAQAPLPRSGLIFLEIGPGAAARIGWKNH
jgi:hypothetical protein